MLDNMKLVFDFIKINHPLGKGISLEEIPELTRELSLRLKISPSLLDYSPVSLNKLDMLIEKYYQEHLLNDNEIEAMSFIRELTAYFGYVLYKNTNCLWKNEGDLWGTEIKYESGFKVIKEGKTQNNKGLIVIIASIATAAVDRMAICKSSDLYKTYKSIASRRLKEKL
jgi:hypothetical protein